MVISFIALLGGVEYEKIPCFKKSSCYTIYTIKSHGYHRDLVSALARALGVPHLPLAILPHRMSIYSERKDLPIIH